MTEKKFTSLKEFYPYYLTEHTHPTSRILHFFGTAFVVFLLFSGFIYYNWVYWAFIPVVGYGFAWAGHYFFEKNKPATFKYPFYSLASDFILFWQLLIGKQYFNPKKP